MSVQNRDLHVSQQKEWVSWSSSSSQGGTFGGGWVGTGATLYIAGPVPYPFIVQSAQAYASGSSGAPQVAFSLVRLSAGVAATVIALGISNLVVPVSSSLMAITAYSGLAAAGSTLLIGQAGDMILATTQGANTASINLVLNMVLQKTQDLVSYNGVST
jgi:hypothetical protein